MCFDGRTLKGEWEENQSTAGRIILNSSDVYCEGRDLHCRGRPTCLPIIQHLGQTHPYPSMGRVVVHYFLGANTLSKLRECSILHDSNDITSNKPHPPQFFQAH